MPQHQSKFQLLGTGIKLVESNLISSLGLIVKRYFQIYPSPEPPAERGSKSVKSGWSRDGLPSGFSGSVPFCNSHKLYNQSSSHNNWHHTS